MILILVIAKKQLTLIFIIKLLEKTLDYYYIIHLYQKSGKINFKKSIKIKTTYAVIGKHVIIVLKFIIR